MAQVLIRNLEKPLVDRLKKQAQAAGRSLEEHVRITLENAAERFRLEEEALRREKHFLKQFKNWKFPSSMVMKRKPKTH